MEESMSGKRKKLPTPCWSCGGWELGTFMFSFFSFFLGGGVKKHTCKLCSYRGLKDGFFERKITQPKRILHFQEKRTHNKQRIFSEVHIEFNFFHLPCKFWSSEKIHNCIYKQYSCTISVWYCFWCQSDFTSNMGVIGKPNHKKHNSCCL